MRYSLEPRYRKYVQGQGFMSFTNNIGNKYGKKLFDNSIDVGKNMSNKYGRKILDKIIDAGEDFAKIAGKKMLTKSAEATGEMIGNKVADSKNYRKTIGSLYNYYRDKLSDDDINDNFLNNNVVNSNAFI